MEPTEDTILTAGSLPLSLSQLEVWRDQRAWPGSAHLNLGGGAFIEGPLDMPRLERALAQLVAGHAALRLVLQPDGTQRLLPVYRPELQLIDMTGQRDARQAMRDWWQHWMRQPIALHDGTPPWRFALLRAKDPKTESEYPRVRLLTIFQQIAYAVAFAHSRGVVHRWLGSGRDAQACGGVQTSRRRCRADSQRQEGSIRHRGVHGGVEEPPPSGDCAHQVL